MYQYKYQAPQCVLTSFLENRISTYYQVNYMRVIQFHNISSLHESKFVRDYYIPSTRVQV